MFGSSIQARRSRKKPMVLQVTSLLDMFTIILVFLMMSFQSEDKEFVLHPGLELPMSSAKSPFKTAVNLAITEQEVLVEGVPVLSLQAGGKVTDEQFAAGQINAITEAVAEAWKQHDTEEGEENVVVIQADKALPYRTIHLVMRSAAKSGFFRFRLVIEKE